MVTPRQADLLQNLIGQGILDKPNLGSLKLPKIATQAPIRNRKTDYASYLMANALESKGVAKAMSRSLASNKSAQEEEQSVLTRLFDYLSIPNYTVANIADSLTEGGPNPNESLGQNLSELKDVGGNILEGLTAIVRPGLKRIPGIGDDIDEAIEGSFLDQEKTTFSDVLHENFGVDNKIGRFGGGFALDVALDPLTYVGGLGLLRRGAKSATEALDAKAAIPESIIKKPMPQASVATDAVRKSTVPSMFRSRPPELPRVDIPEQPNLQPITRGLRRHQDTPTGLTPGQLRAASQQEIPDEFGRGLTERMVRNQKDWERKLTKVGVVTEGTRLNLRAVDEVIRHIEDGRVPRVLPKPPSVSGEAVERARDIADEAIAKAMGQKVNKGKKLTWRGPGGKIESRKLPPELSAGMQINLFNKVLATGPQNIEESIGLLRAAEDHLISLKVQPTAFEGMRVRLSDVLNLMKDKIDTEVPLEKVLNNFARKDVKKMEPEIRDAIQTVVAYRTSTMSDILENLTSYAEKAKRSVSDSYIGRQKTAAEAEIIDSSIAHAATLGATAKELGAIKNLIKDVVEVDKLPAEKFYSEASEQLTKAFHDGRISGDLIVKFNKMVADSYGYTKDNLRFKVSGNRVVDTMAGAFLTHWGKGHLFPKARGLFDAGMRNAQARAEALRIQSKRFTKDEIDNAWKLVVGNGDVAVADARTMEMANWFRNYFDEVLAVPKYGLLLSNAATKHLSVVERNQMLMKDVNRHLKDMNGANAFQFTDKRYARDAWDIQRNFSKEGEGWQASWGMWKPDDPLKFLYDIDLAMERAVRENVFLDNFVDVFGSLEKGAHHNFKMPLSRISDFYVPEEVGRQMMRIMDDIHKGIWKPRTPLTRFYTKGVRIWKTSVTIYMPSHHIRNGIGDMYLMWLAGHNNPQAFIHAKRIMHSQKGRYQHAIQQGDFATLRELTSPEAIRWADTNGKDVILKHKGTNVTAEQLYVNAFQRGLLRDANQLEDIFGETRIGFQGDNPLARFSRNPLGGQAHKAATGAAEYREHFIRLAHFTSAVNKRIKKGRKDMDAIYDEAANEVRKWHPDGTDLTFFEQKYLRNLIPFYSWLRKSTPLLVQGLVTKPAKTLAFPRGMVALQNMLGVESTISDPFPEDQLFPDWLKESGIGPIGDPRSDNPISAWWGNLGRNMIDIEGKPYGYTIVNPGNPFIDQARQILGHDATPRDIGRGIIDQLSPFVKVPYELFGSGREFTDAPIYKEDGGRGVVQYLMKQFGGTAPFQRYLDIGETDRVGVEPQSVDIPAIINNLTAAGVYGSGPYIKSAEFDLRDRLKAAKK